MSRPLIFRRALDVLRLSNPIDDFSGFVQYSELAGLSINDVEALSCLYDNAKNDLFLLITCQDDSFTLDACADLASSVGQKRDDVYSLMYDLRYSTTLSAGSSDEIPLKFSDSGLSFSTEGCMKGEISVCGCESFEPCIKVPEYVNGGRSRYHVVAIAPNAFSEKTSISSIILPESIRDIGYRAFYGCSSMNDFILPSSVRRIGFRAFEGCVSLSSIAISFKNPFFRTFPGGLLCSLKKVDGRLVPSEVIRAPYSLSGSVTVPEGITKIGSESFEGCSGLTEVVLPDEVSAVMYRAFVGCSSLEHVCVPDRASVGFHAFPDAVSVETRQVGGPSDEVLQE